MDDHGIAKRIIPITLKTASPGGNHGQPKQLKGLILVTESSHSPSHHGSRRTVVPLTPHAACMHAPHMHVHPPAYTPTYSVVDRLQTVSSSISASMSGCNHWQPIVPFTLHACSVVRRRSQQACQVVIIGSPWCPSPYTPAVSFVVDRSKHVRL